MHLFHRNQGEETVVADVLLLPAPAAAAAAADVVCNVPTAVAQLSLSLASPSRIAVCCFLVSSSTTRMALSPCRQHESRHCAKSNKHTMGCRAFSDALVSIFSRSCVVLTMEAMSSDAYTVSCRGSACMCDALPDSCEMVYGVTTVFCLFER